MNSVMNAIAGIKKRRKERRKADVERKEMDRIFKSKNTLGEKLKELLPEQEIKATKVG